MQPAGWELMRRDHVQRGLVVTTEQVERIFFQVLIRNSVRRGMQRRPIEFASATVPCTGFGWGHSLSLAQVIAVVVVAAKGLSISVLPCGKT